MSLGSALPRGSFWIILASVVLLTVGVGTILVIVPARTDPGIPNMVQTRPEALSGEWEPAEGERLPGFTLIDAQTGKPISLNEFQGRPVMINFWATWCSPCRDEMPLIEAAYQQYREQHLVVLAVNSNEPQESVIAFGEELGLSFNLLLDPDGKVQELYRVRGYPWSLFVNPDGRLSVAHLGILTDRQLAGSLARILP